MHTQRLRIDSPRQRGDGGGGGGGGGGGNYTAL